MKIPAVQALGSLALKIALILMRFVPFPSSPDRRLNRLLIEFGIERHRETWSRRYSIDLKRFSDGSAEPPANNGPSLKHSPASSTDDKITNEIERVIFISRNERVR